MKYASFLRISRALHPNVFDQPVKKHFFNNLLEDMLESIEKFRVWPEVIV
jgi:hypothetical protein